MNNQLVSHEPQVFLEDTLAIELTDLAQDYSGPVVCPRCGRSWTPDDAMRVMVRALGRHEL